MDLDFNFFLGAGMVLFGLYTLIARQVAPQQFAKLGPMKEKWGPKAGLAVHIIGYSVVPVVAGTAILFGQLL